MQAGRQAGRQVQRRTGSSPYLRLLQRTAVPRHSALGLPHLLLGLRVGSIKGHQGGHKQISGAMHNGLMALMLGGSAKVCPMANRHTQSQAGVQPSSGSNQAAEAAHPRDAVDLLPRSRRAFPARRLAR